MPLITKCMCWDNIYSASRAAAMYTLCLSTNLLLLYLFKFSTYIPAHDEDPFMVVVYKAWFLLLLIYALYFITSFILLNGIEKAFVGMVLFFLTFLVAAEIIETGIIVLLLVEGGFTSTIHVEFSLYIVKLVPNILIFVVVLSCYQALKEQKRNEKNYDDLVRKGLIVPGSPMPSAVDRDDEGGFDEIYQPRPSTSGNNNNANLSQLDSASAYIDSGGARAV